MIARKQQKAQMGIPVKWNDNEKTRHGCKPPLIYNQLSLKVKWNDNVKNYTWLKATIAMQSAQSEILKF